MNFALYKCNSLYIRLSREDEEKEKYQESESIVNQSTLLMEYIKENKLNFIAEYFDDGVSGTSFDKPAFNRMIADIEAGKINMVVQKTYDTSNNDIAPFKSILNEMYAKDISKKINSVLQSKRKLGKYLGTG